MSDKTWRYFAGISFVLVLLFFIGFFGSIIGSFFSDPSPITVRLEVQAEAVKAGAAHWILDAESGKPKFEWIDSREREGK